MKSEDNKRFRFATDLKASNIEENTVSLDENSMQIELLLNQIQYGGNKVAEQNIESCKKAVRQSREVSPLNKLNEYVKLGERLLFLLPEENKNDSENMKFYKQIAICYLDIAKLVNDERVKKLSFSIADKLIQNDNQ